MNSVGHVTAGTSLRACASEVMAKSFAVLTTDDAVELGAWSDTEAEMKRLATRFLENILYQREELEQLQNLMRLLAATADRNDRRARS